MSDRSTMTATRKKLAHCLKLLKSYDLVLEDLDDWDESEWAFVRERLKWMRADVEEEVTRMKRDIAADAERVP